MTSLRLIATGQLTATQNGKLLLRDLDHAAERARRHRLGASFLNDGRLAVGKAYVGARRVQTQGLQQNRTDLVGPAARLQAHGAHRDGWR